MILGFICVVLASIAFGIGPVFAKELMICGLDTMNILLWPKISTLLVAGVVMLSRRISLKVTKTQLWQLFLFCGCSNGLTALMLVSSYRLLPIGLATMFHFIYPTIVTVIMLVLFKEKVSALKIIAIVLAISGLSLIFDLSGSMSFPGVALALGSGCTYAIYIVATRKSAYRELHALVLIFYSSAINFLAVAIYLLVTGGLIIPVTGREWLFITSNGLISGLFAFFILIAGIKRIGASNAAIANMLEPLTALVAGVIIYGDRIEFKALCGCILVIIAITLITIKNKNYQPDGEL